MGEVKLIREVNTLTRLGLHSRRGGSTLEIRVRFYVSVHYSTINRRVACLEGCSMELIVCVSWGEKRMIEDIHWFPSPAGLLCATVPFVTWVRGAVYELHRYI